MTVRESFPSRTFSIEAQDTGIVRLQADITASDGSTFVCNTQVRAIGAADAPLTCAESPSFSVVPGRTFSRDIPAASGGSGGNRYTKLTGPTWLNVSSAGTVSGTAPSDSGSFSWSYRVTDSSGSICDGRAGTVRVRTVAASTLVCGSAPAIAAQVGTAFSATIPEATGGVGSKTYSLNTGAPSWLSLSGRTLSGTAPSSAGSFSYSYTATDSASPASTCTSSATITITTGTPTLTCSAAPSFSVRAEEAFSTVIPQVSGGRGPFRFALNTGAPSWLRLTGRTLRGTAPSSTGAYSYGYTVTDADDSTCTASGTITVTAPPLSCEPAPSFAVTTGGVFSMQITVPSGGSGNVTFTKVSGPAWLNISTSGLVSGTAPATAGEHPYVYQASDGTDTCRGNGIASVVVQNIQCAAVPNITASINRSFTGTIPNATAGRGLKSYRKESGAAWITISGQTVSGTAPTTAGTYNYSYRASDLTGSCTGAGRIIVSDPSQPLSVRLEPADARGLLDTSLEVTAVATGGQPPYTYSKKAGSSDQVTVHSDGRVVLAAQSTAGTFSYTVVATDSATPTAATAEAAGTFTVSDKAPLEFDDIDIRLAQPNVPIVRWEIHPFIKGGKEPYTVTFVGTPPTGYVVRTRSIGNPVDGFVDRWYLEFPGPGEFEDISLQLRVTDADNDSAISNVTVRVQDLTVWAYTNRVAVGSIGFIPLGAGGRGAGSAYTRVAVAPGSEETVRKAPGGINGLRTAPRFIGQGFDYSLDILSSVDDTVIGTFVYGYTTVGSFQVTGTTAVQRGTTTAWTISVTPPLTPPTKLVSRLIHGPSWIRVRQVGQTSVLQLSPPADEEPASTPVRIAVKDTNDIQYYTDGDFGGSGLDFSEGLGGGHDDGSFSNVDNSGNPDPVTRSFPVIGNIPSTEVVGGGGTLGINEGGYVEGTGGTTITIGDVQVDREIGAENEMDVEVQVTETPPLELTCADIIISVTANPLQSGSNRIVVSSGRVAAAQVMWDIFMGTSRGVTFASRGSFHNNIYIITGIEKAAFYGLMLVQRINQIVYEFTAEARHEGQLAICRGTITIQRSE